MKTIEQAKKEIMYALINDGKDAAQAFDLISKGEVEIVSERVVMHTYSNKQKLRRDVYQWEDDALFCIASLEKGEKEVEWREYQE